MLFHDGAELFRLRTSFVRERRVPGSLDASGKIEFRFAVANQSDLCLHSAKFI